MKKGLLHIGIHENGEKDILQIGSCLKELEESSETRAVLDLYQDPAEVSGFCDILIMNLKSREDMKKAEEISCSRRHIHLILIGEDQQFVLEGYKIRAFRFLVRPLTPNRIREAIRSAMEDLQEEDGILFTVKNGLLRICPDDIYYAEIYGRKIRLVLRNQSFVVEETMTGLEEKLDPDLFVRCHKSFLVHRGHIRAFTGSFLELQNGENVPVSKRRLKEVKENMKIYL